MLLRRLSMVMMMMMMMLLLGEHYSASFVLLILPFPNPLCYTRICVPLLLLSRSSASTGVTSNGMPMPRSSLFLLCACLKVFFYFLQTVSNRRRGVLPELQVAFTESHRILMTRKCFLSSLLSRSLSLPLFLCSSSPCLCSVESKQKVWCRK